jgi:hypothetical protein
VFWDSEEIIHVHIFAHGVTINTQYYTSLFHSDVH